MLDATKTTNKSLPTFKDREIQYLKEFVQVMEPLSFALDSLQGDKQMYYGQLLPTLFSLKTRLEMLQRTGFAVIGPLLVPKLIEALHKRFRSEYELHDSASLAVLATVSHPNFKLRWTFDDALEQRAREIFMKEVKKITSNASRTATSQQQKPTTSDFIILRPSANVIDEARLFLEDTREDMNHLHCYPAVLKLFKRANTPLCSSAPLERTFNYAGMINNPKRGRMSPRNFETSVVLKGNQVFKENELKKSKENK